MSIRLLIVDDHGVLRAGLRALLNAEVDMEVVGEAATGQEAIHVARSLKPQVVLMDISMPGMSGIETTAALLASDPKVRVLLITIHEDESLLRAALKSGASGYILKRAVESELINAIRAVAAGDLYVHPALTRALLEQPSTTSKRKSSESTLTQREMEVLQLIAHGYTNRQVAEQLHISIRTVESHRANLMAKLEVSSRVELVRFAKQHGMLLDE